MNKALILTFLLLVGCAQAVNTNPMNNQPPSSVLSYHLEAKESYALGDSVNISFVLENHTDSPVWVLAWYTPFEGMKGDIFKVTCNEREIPYEGPLVKRGDPDQADYKRIGPEDSISTAVDLSLGYNLSTTGVCQVEFSGRIYDLVGDESLLPRKRGQHNGIDIAGNPVSFSLVSP